MSLQGNGGYQARDRVRDTEGRMPKRPKKSGEDTGTIARLQAKLAEANRLIEAQRRRLAVAEPAVLALANIATQDEDGWAAQFVALQQQLAEALATIDQLCEDADCHKLALLEAGLGGVEQIARLGETSYRVLNIS